MNSGPYLIPSKKINSRWVIDLDMRVRIIKPLEEHNRKQSLLHGLGADKDFLDLA